MTSKSLPNFYTVVLSRKVKELPKYIPRHPKKTSKRAISIPFLNPKRGRNDPIKNETNAIDKSRRFFMVILKNLLQHNR